jgi:hypothetical protein
VSWVGDYGFLSDDHECNWRSSVDYQGGVICGDGLVVTGLHVTSTGLIGIVPPEIWALEDLETIILTNKRSKDISPMNCIN